MALTDSSLKAKIITEVENLYGPADDSAILSKFAEAIAKAVVDEITSNAVVPSGIAVTVNIGTGIGATTAPGTVT